MAQKQKATGIITLSAVPIRICCPLLCLLLKNTCFPFAIALRTGIIYRTQTPTNKFLKVVCLFVFKMSICLTFITKKMAEVRQTLQIGHLTSLVFCVVL